MAKHRTFLTDEAEALLKLLGRQVEIARVRRGLRVKDLVGAGISESTYARLKAGDPGVSIGTLANVLTVFDLEGTLALVADPDQDEVGKFLERRDRRQRVRKVDHEQDLDRDF